MKAIALVASLSKPNLAARKAGVAMSAQTLVLPNEPDLIVYNARIYTVDKALPWAEAVAIRKHRITAIGTNADVLALAGTTTRRMDLGGRLVLPGLCDAHIHFLGYCLRLRELSLDTTKSKAEALQRIAEHAAALPPGSWISGGGWNESRWQETDFPTAADLDPVTGPDHPTLLTRSDGHSAVVNSAALSLAGIDADTPNPPGGVIDRGPDGRPTGFLRELAIDLVAQYMPQPGAEEIDSALAEGSRSLHKLGITSVHAQRMKDSNDGTDEWAGLLRLREKYALRLRVSCNIAAHHLPHLAVLGLRTGFGDQFLRMGHVKVFTDGSLGSRTAWLLQPFEKLDSGEADNLGVNVTPPEQMAAEFRQACELGFPISVHAIGDRANRVVLDIFEELAQSAPPPPVPHRIEHVQIIDPADLPRLARLGITASVQPIHATDDMDTADLFLGERGAHMYNFRSLFAGGALVAFGSDAPVADPNPFLGFHAALTRRRPERMGRDPWYAEERVTLEQTIFAYTLGAAKAVGWDKMIGSLTQGKLADLVVLDRDLFALEQAGITGCEVAETQVVMTVFGGEIVYERS
jgi:predicted amidohydrolase YtcJ